MMRSLLMSFALVVVGACASPRTGSDSPAAAATQVGWLATDADSMRLQLDPHLRGLDVAMVEIGYRYGELVGSARAREWAYAQYQAEKIALALRLAIERRPARAKSAAPFRDSTLKGVIEIVKARDAARVDSAMSALYVGCLSCHASENVSHFNSAVERIRARAW